MAHAGAGLKGASKGTPSSNSREKAEAKSLKNSSCSTTSALRGCSLVSHANSGSRWSYSGEAYLILCILLHPGLQLFVPNQSL